MKKIVYFLGILFFSVPLFSANLTDTLNSWMNEANIAYQNKNYSKAISLYENISDRSFESSILYYNLGNAYYKNEDLSHAILNYERALKLDPSNEDIIHNIAFVNQKLEDNIEMVPELFITRWYKSISSLFSFEQWAILSIISFGILLLSIIGFLLIRNIWVRYFSFGLQIMSIIILIFSILFSIHTNNIMNDQKDAIVMKSVIVGKSMPNETGNDLFVVHEGLKVQITDQLNEWYEIKLPNGEKGWVPYSEIEKITTKQ
jgi:tetratricopeptide (TPR) repeat protein